MRLRLFDWGPSPFCMKVRAILDYKGVPCERIGVLGRASLCELTRRSAVRKVPALDVDGRMAVDSADIAHEIERLLPKPPVLSPEPRLAGLSHALEEWADEALNFIGLYCQWIGSRGQPMVRKAFGAAPLGIAARFFYQRRIAAQVRGHGAALLREHAMLGACMERMRSLRSAP
jgi:glutathione S-transferase